MRMAPVRGCAQWLAAASVVALCCATYLGASDGYAQQTRPVRKGTQRAVEIDSTPQQATIYLDDERFGIVGTTPWKGKLAEGSWRLLLRKDGFEPRDVTIVVSRASTRFVETLRERPKPARIEITADADSNVRGALVHVNGEVKGPAPLGVEVAPGRHQVEILRDAFEPFRQWVVVEAGQTWTLAPALKAKALEPASLLVDADVPQASVRVDGKLHPEVAPTLVEGLTPGPHVVEVAVAGVVPWRGAIDLKPGERGKVRAELAAAVEAARPKAPAAPPAAAAPAGPAPAPPAAPPPKFGVVVVRTTPPGAEVQLDGKAMGVAPLRIRQVRVGQHVVVARQGATRAERAFDLQADATVELDLSLQPAAPGAQPPPAGTGQPAAQPPASAPPPGEAKQPTPPPRPAPGAPGDAGAPPSASLPNPADLSAPPPAPARPPDVNDAMGVGDGLPAGALLTTWGARVLREGALGLDLGMGYPHYVDLRASAGVVRDQGLALDAAIHLRSSFALTEAALQLRFRLAEGGPFAAAVFASVGGGSGPGGRNSFVVETGVAGSVFFGQRASVTLGALLDIGSYRLCPASGSDEAKAKEGPTVCHAAPAAGSYTEQRLDELLDGDKLSDRNTTLRFTVRATLEVAGGPRWNLYLQGEASPGQAERPIYTRLLHGAMIFTQEPEYRGRGGITFLF